MNRKLFLLPILLGVMLPIATCSASITVKKGITYRTSDRSSIKFDYDSTSSKIYFNDSMVKFVDLDMGYGIFEDIGFTCKNSTGKLTVNDVKPNRIKYTIYLPTGISVTKIYVGDKGEPDSIKNDYESEYDNGVLTIESTHTSFVKHKTIEIIYRTADENLDPIEQKLIEGNEIEAAIQPYIDIMGEEVFYGLIVIVGFIPLFIRPQSYPFVVIFFILVGALIETIIPGPLISYGKGLIALGIFMILIKLFWRRKYN